jgi:hypothetical protein
MTANSGSFQLVIFIRTLLPTAESPDRFRCRPREGGDPVCDALCTVPQNFYRPNYWMPAFAGKTSIGLEDLPLVIDRFVIAPMFSGTFSAAIWPGQ